MKTDNETSKLLCLFKEYAIKRWEFLKQGNAKTSNEYYDKLKNIEKKLAGDNCIDRLNRYLADDNIAVKFETAVILNKYNNAKAKTV